MRVFHTRLKTSGGGLWSNVARDISTTYTDMPYVDSDEEFAELRVYFNTHDWDVREDGLIYTDPRWVEDLREELIRQGYTPRAVGSIDYSEQGMQGTDYVSLDAEQPFIREWLSAEVDSEDE